MTVQGHDSQYVRIVGKLDAWDVAVYVQRQIHLTGHLALDVKSMNSYFRVVYTWHRVLVFVCAWIDCVFVE